MIRHFTNYLLLILVFLNFHFIAIAQESISYKDSVIQIAEKVDFAGNGNKKLTYNMIDIIEDMGTPSVLVSSNNKRTTAIAVSPDSRYFAHGSRSVSIWDVYTKSIVFQIRSHKNYVSTIMFSPDNQFILSGDQDGVLCITDASTGFLVKKMFIHRGGISSITFSKDGNMMLTAGIDNIVRIWDANTWKSVRKIVMRAPINSVNLSEDKSFLAVCFNMGSFDIYNLETSDIERSYGGDFAKAQEFITKVDFLPNSNSNNYISTTQAGNLIFWNGKDKKISYKINFKEANSMYTFLDFCPDGDKYITAFFGTDFDKGYIRAWDINTNEITTNLRLSGNLEQFYVKGLMSDDKKNLFMVYQDVESETSDVVMYNMEISYLLCEK